MKWKDVLIGLLVAYIAIDVMMSSMMKRSMPNAFEKMMDAVSDSNGLLVIVIGLLIGLCAWYFASRSKECFKFTKSKDQKVEDETSI